MESSPPSSNVPAASVQQGRSLMQNLRRHGTPRGAFAPIRPPATGLAGLLCLVVTVSAAEPAPPSPEAIDQAVARGLGFLASQQLEDGAWRSNAWGPSTGMTSLVLLAHFSAGELPGAGPTGAALQRGADWVVSHQQPDGALVNHPNSQGPQFEHGMSTLMLAQLIGMTPRPEDESLQPVLEKAVARILSTQTIPGRAWNPGGWPRKPAEGGDSDLGVTVWQIMALRAARQAGCSVPDETLANARQFVLRCSARGGHGFGHIPGTGASPTMSAAGIVCLEMLGEHRAEQALTALRWCELHPIEPDGVYFHYGAYLTRLAETRLNPDATGPAGQRFLTLLLERQHSDGSWTSTFEREQQAGPVFCTSLAILALTMDYGFLPIHQL